MNILGLPGKNEATGPWMTQILATIAGDTHHYQTQFYECWRRSAAQLDEDHELDVAARFNPELIVAKSLGTLVTLIGIEREVLTPTACVLIGIPVDTVLNESERQILNTLPERDIKTLFIQQTDDITGRAANLKALVPSSEKNTIAEIPGHDHVYADINELTSIIKLWLSETSGSLYNP